MASDGRLRMVSPPTTIGVAARWDCPSSVDRLITVPPSLQQPLHCTRPSSAEVLRPPAVGAPTPPPLSSPGASRRGWLQNALPGRA